MRRMFDHAGAARLICVNVDVRHGGAAAALTAINRSADSEADTLLAPPKAHTMYQRILVPIDGSPTSNQGLDEAIALARLTKGSIRLVHVLDELVFVTGFETGVTYANTVLPALRRRSESILAAGRKRVAAASVAVETTTSECFARRPSDVIVEQAAEWPADLIVIGTHGRRGVNRVMLGSDAEQIVRMAPVPVLLVRSNEDAARAPASDAREPPVAAEVGRATA